MKFRSSVRSISECGTDPKASSKSKKAMWHVLFLCLASFIIIHCQTCYIKMGTCHAPQGNESIRIHLLSNTFIWNLNQRKLNKKFKIKKKIGSIYISRAKSNTLLDTTCFMMNCLSECLVLYQFFSTIIQLFRITILSKFKNPDTWVGGSIFKRRVFYHMTVSKLLRMLKMSNIYFHKTILPNHHHSPLTRWRVCIESLASSYNDDGEFHIIWRCAPYNIIFVIKNPTYKKWELGIVMKSKGLIFDIKYLKYLIWNIWYLLWNPEIW